MDLKAICDALAVRYDPGTISTPTGAQAIRNSYGQMPHSMPNTPSVVIVPQEGEATPGTGMWDLRNKIDVNFYISKAPGDLARVELQRQLWLPTLLSACTASMNLGIAVVKSTFPISWEFIELPYGGDQYDGIVIHLEVWVQEAQAFAKT